MKTQANVVQAIYNNAMRNVARQQIREGFVVETMTKEDHAAMHKMARSDIEKIAQAAGVEMPKIAHIAIRRGMRQQQETGLKK